MKKLLTLVLSLLIVGSLGACKAPNKNTEIKEPEATETQAEDSNTLSYSAFDASEYPNYVRLYDMPCTIDFELKPGEVTFSPLDELGRSGRAVGRITKELVDESAGWRTEFAPNSDPSGWGHNEKVAITFDDGKTYNGWMYNRSHLIADSLGGYDHVYYSDGSVNQDESTTPKTNLITGTRPQNVGENDGDGGMQYFETMVVDYLNEHPDKNVWYSARPVYEGTELLPRSVIVSLKSSDGELEAVGEVFNAAQGYVIDYQTGTFTAA